MGLNSLVSSLGIGDASSSTCQEYAGLLQWDPFRLGRVERGIPRDANLMGNDRDITVT
jgi:hypothetical protein